MGSVEEAIASKMLTQGRTSLTLSPDKFSRSCTRPIASQACPAEIRRPAYTVCFRTGTRSRHHVGPFTSAAHPLLRPLRVHAILVAVSATLSSGCHRSRPQTATTPSAWIDGDHCWWARYRTAMPPDSVAARYARAYATLGLATTGWSHQADTAWAESGPTVLSRSGSSATYASRVVAYRLGDTTFVRPFVTVRNGGEVNVGSLSIQFCGDVSRAAQAGTTAPREEERDDSLPVWRRRPMR